MISSVGPPVAESHTVHHMTSHLFGLSDSPRHRSGSFPEVVEVVSDEPLERTVLTFDDSRRPPSSRRNSPPMDTLQMCHVARCAEAAINHARKTPPVREMRRLEVDYVSTAASSSHTSSHRNRSAPATRRRHHRRECSGSDEILSSDESHRARRRSRKRNHSRRRHHYSSEASPRRSDARKERRHRTKSSSASSRKKRHSKDSKDAEIEQLKQRLQELELLVAAKDTPRCPRCTHDPPPSSTPTTAPATPDFPQQPQPPPATPASSTWTAPPFPSTDAHRTPSTPRGGYALPQYMRRDPLSPREALREAMRSVEETGRPTSFTSAVKSSGTLAKHTVSPVPPTDPFALPTGRIATTQHESKAWSVTPSVRPSLTGGDADVDELEAAFEAARGRLRRH